MVGNQQPITDDRPPLSVSVSMREIYDALCPACQQVLLDLISSKASAGMVREGLRQQLEAPARPEGPEDRRREHS